MRTDHELFMTLCFAQSDIELMRAHACPNTETRTKLLTSCRRTLKPIFQRVCSNFPPVMYNDWILFWVRTWCWSGDELSSGLKMTQLQWCFYAPPDIVDHNTWYIITWSRKNSYQTIMLKIDEDTEHVSCWIIECAWYARRAMTLIHVSPTLIF